MFAIREANQAQAKIIGLLLALLLALLLSSTKLFCQALKVSAQIPDLVKLNDPFWLNCSSHQLAATRKSHQEDSPTSPAAADLTATTKDWNDIYAIKWYKDEEEFYRFLPNGQPKVSIYETNGVQLDQTRSHEGNVYINKADVNSEGIYRCEILSEAPVFETVRKSKQLRVYALPVRGPRIEILDSQGRPKSPKAQEISYAVGDKIELRCNSAPSKPAAKLRWYLNEHEIAIPWPAPANATPPNPNQQATRSWPPREEKTAAGYDVRVTPMEFRQHYKSIYSSHSTLSLVLRQDDLINNKISFKCLASMRQEVPLRSKQLILLMPSLPSSSVPLNNNKIRRARRQMQISARHSVEAAASNQQTSRQRPPNQRHSVARLQQQQHQQQQQQQQQDGRSKLINNQLFDDNEQRPSGQQMLYIYEEANAALGSTIIDTLEALDSYLSQSGLLADPQTNRRQQQQQQGANNSNNNGATFGDNFEYIQSLRERTRHRSAGGQKQRLHGGPNALVRSPLYLDENEPLRPIIGWPPLEAGKLQLMAGGLLAQPTFLLNIPHPNTIKWSDQPQDVPSAAYGSGSGSGSGSDEPQRPPGLDEQQFRRLMVEKLLARLNCTCSEGSADSRLSWLINDNLLDGRDTRFYPAPRASHLDQHRPTQAIGLAADHLIGSWSSSSAPILDSPSRAAPSSSSSSSSSSMSLKSLLAGYLAASSPAEPPPLLAKAPGTTSNEQLRFVCQAIHSMLLHSSSEMITFDFNPPTSNAVPTDDISSSSSGTNIVDKFSASSSNVIQASTSASQSSGSSAAGSQMQTQGSQSVIFLLISGLAATALLAGARQHTGQLIHF